jgi:hypothetical protein
MKKSFLIFLMSAFCFVLFAKEGDTTVINFYTKYDIQQFLGPQWHKNFKYIDPTKKYKKAILKIDLGCASYGCCAWDYTFRGFIGKPLPGIDSTITKKNNPQVYRYYQKSTNWEVARLITPYSSYMRMSTNGYTPSWTHPYVYDITDFLPLLKDTVGFVANTGGWDDQGDFGFSMSVNLYLIEGTNSLVPSQVHKVYENSYVYKAEDTFDMITKPYKFKLSGKETQAKFKSIITGHDGDGEFTPIDYYVKMNGNQVYNKLLWKEDCDKTYIQPQSGTWIFSRTNWCPGERIVENEIDLTPYLSKTDSSTVDIAFGPMPASVATPYKANYIIAGYVITYTDMPKRDVEIEDIIAPSADPNHRMSNKMCMEPKVRIKNVGKDIVKKLYIDYWVDSGYKNTYIWNGNLANGQSEDINLPSISWTGINPTNPVFTACIQFSDYNLRKWNDTLKRPFPMPNLYMTEKLILELKTSNGTVNAENTLKVINENNTVVFEKTYSGDSKLYKEAINVPAGCYKLTLTDKEVRFGAGDGLSFWLSNRSLGTVAGSFRILNGNNNAELIKFNPDFGGLIMHQFTTMNKVGDYPTSLVNTQINAPKIADSLIKYSDLSSSINSLQGQKNIEFNLFPNPTKNLINIEFSSLPISAVEITIFSAEGKTCLKDIKNIKKLTESIDIKHLSKGAYILKVKEGDLEQSKRFLIN